MAHGEIPVDPAEIGIRPNAKLDKGLEAFEGLTPTSEYRPLNPAEIRDLLGLEIGLLPKGEAVRIAKSWFEGLIVYARLEVKETEDKSTKRFTQDYIPTLKSLLLSVREGEYSKPGHYFLTQARWCHENALRYEAQAQRERQEKLNVEAKFDESMASTCRKDTQQCLQLAATFAKAVEAKG